VANGHRKLRSIPVPPGQARGISAHPASGRLYLTNSNSDTVMAFELTTDRLLWSRSYPSCKHVDRLNVTADGRWLYVPCKKSDRHLVLDAANGDLVKTIAMDRAPHDTWTGESGRWVYLSAYRNETLLVVDPRSHEIVQRVGPFSSGIRPFVANRDETLVFCTLTNLLGFAIGDPATGKVLLEVEHRPPAERLAHPEAAIPPGRGEAKSHGVAIRPGTDEVWIIDNAWGYLYAFDVSSLPPRHLADVPLFEKVDQKWATERWRWVAFSLDGRYAYPGGDGLVVDAETRRVLDVRITPSEKLLEIQFQGGVPVRASGQQGGVYAR
jgi:DNA-binding beta-propeller fold protein YncE